MSSILEALKKLEDEKAARQSGAADIVGKVARSGRRPKQQPKWFLPVVMAAVASVAVLVTYLLMGGRTAPVETMEKKPAVAQIQPQPQTLKPSMPAAEAKPAPSSPPPGKKHVTAAQPPKPAERNVISAPSPPPAKVKRAPVAGTAVPPVKSIAIPETKPAPPSKEEEKPALPSLVISGIGWQKDNADRLAIVNGRPVMEGEMVNGAKVEEIFPDRIRFSMDGRSFDVPMGKYTGESR